MAAPHLDFALERDHFWTTTALLPSWHGFQSRNGAYGSLDQLPHSDGTVKIVFAPEGRGTEPLTAVEIAAVVWVIKNEAEIAKALISSLVAEYPKLQHKYRDFLGEERDILMPDIGSPNDLRSLIGLRSVHVHQVQKNGIPYAGFEFGCTWDDEHGLGVLMHGTRTIQIGNADTAFLLWIAKKDGGVAPN